MRGEEHAMSESKATPGPWHVSDRSIVTDDVCIAVVDDHGEYADWEHWEANAALIAAAPALLGALEAAYSHFFTHDPEEMGPEELRELETLLRAALDLARGEGSER